MSNPEDQWAREAGIDRCDICGDEHHTNEHGDPERPPFYKDIPAQVLDYHGISRKRVEAELRREHGDLEGEGHPLYVRGCPVCEVTRTSRDR